MRRLPMRAACHEVPQATRGDALGLEESLFVEFDTREHYARAVVGDASAQTIAQGRGLLEDFLEHEGVIATLFELGQRELEFLYVYLGGGVGVDRDYR